jgi:thiamine-phosphate pyrophosphorylase
VPDFRLPRIYPILDVACFADEAALFAAARALAASGGTLIQYRNKTGSSREMLSQARELRRILGTVSGKKITLIMNDRADLALAAPFDGVHVGQDDLSVAAVRRIVGPNFIVGASAHNPEQVKEADAAHPDYIAIGPIFITVSKANPDPVVGLEGVRLARSLTKRPLVAIGGITLAHAHSVIAAGADSLALISALLPDPAKSFAQFHAALM